MTPKRKTKSSPVKSTTRKKPGSPDFALTQTQQFGLVVAIVVVLVLAHLAPLIFQGRVPAASDALAWKGGAQSIIESREEHDSNPLWANNLFAGMPAIMISVKAPFEQPARYLINLFSAIIGWQATYYIIAALGLVLLMRFWKTSYFAALFAAIAYVGWPHVSGLLEAGHNTKVRVIMLLPLILWSFLRLLKKSTLLNAAMFAILFSLGIQGGHYQIMFYICLALAAFGLLELYNYLTNKDFRGIGLKSAVIFGSLIAALGISAFPALTVQEYTEYSIRGGSGTSSGGLGYEYATSWSLYPGEMMTFLMPKFYGGNSSETYKGKAVPQLAGQQIPGYWGHKPFTSSTDYVGVISLVLATIAIILLWRKQLVLALTAISILAILIAFGRHFPLIYDLFFNYIPFFNKFRVPIMILVLLQFTVAVLAGLGLDYLRGLADSQGQHRILSKLGIILAVFLFLALTPFLFKSSFALAQAAESTSYKPEVLAPFKEARYDLMSQDAQRMVFFLVAAAVLILAFLKHKLARIVFSGGLILLLTIDLYSVNSRYLNNLVKEAKIGDYFEESPANRYLKQDNSLYRVFPLGKLYGDNRWAYHHQTIGGYHPAKLQLIQELNEHTLYRGTAPGFRNTSGVPINWNVINMLNAKYLIAPGRLQHAALKEAFVDKANNLTVYENLGSLPRVFSVSQYEIIKERNQRLERINDPDFNPAETAILEEDIGLRLTQAQEFVADVTTYEPNRIEIDVSTDQQTLMVLSEIYYPAGWTAHIDGEETEIYRTNHALRSVLVPEGQHKVEFRFKPKSYQNGVRLMGASILAVYLMLGIGVVRQGLPIFRNQRPKRAGTTTRERGG